MKSLSGLQYFALAVCLLLPVSQANPVSAKDERDHRQMKSSNGNGSGVYQPELKMFDTQIGQNGPAAGVGGQLLTGQYPLGMQRYDGFMLGSYPGFMSANLGQGYPGFGIGLQQQQQLQYQQQLQQQQYQQAHQQPGLYPFAGGLPNNGLAYPTGGLSGGLYPGYGYPNGGQLSSYPIGNAGSMEHFNGAQLQGLNPAVGGAGLQQLGQFPQLMAGAYGQMPFGAVV